MSSVWRNWAGNEQASPVRVERPTDPAEAATAVKGAVRDGLRGQGGRVRALVHGARRWRRVCSWT
ncbi:hypothetical protein ACU686_43155 [Yinghuangia aomiensis]